MSSIEQLLTVIGIIYITYTDINQVRYSPATIKSYKYYLYNLYRNKPCTV
jgi:hypothetical protein